MMAQTKYDIGKKIYVPFTIYQISITEKGAKYTAKADGFKDMVITVTTDELDSMIEDFAEDLFKKQ